MRLDRLFWLYPVLLAAACDVGPDYEKPAVQTPTAFKEAGTWQQAEPADTVERGAWWKVFHDATLDKLEEQIALSNQNVKSYEAAYRQAQALTDEARAGWFPTVSLNGSDTRSATGKSGTKSASAYASSLNASWTADVWGRIGRTVESNEAKAEASAADLAGVQLSAQTTLATDYLDLRWQDEQITTLRLIAEANRKLAEIEKSRYDAGTDGKQAWLAAQQNLDAAEATLSNAQITREQLEHAIATLIGTPASQIAVPKSGVPSHVPHIPAQIPSNLLQQRPDIASAERAVAAANADIGVATAAWFPTFSFDASYGYSAAILPRLLQSPYSLWSFGPSVAETLFDAGNREATIEAARAGYDQTVATYRQTALTAFQEVEDDLSSLHHLTDQVQQQQSNLEHARAAQDIVEAQQKVGTSAVSDVLTARITRLKAQQSWQIAQQQRYETTVALIEALGGTWTTGTVENKKE